MRLYLNTRLGDAVIRDANGENFPRLEDAVTEAEAIVREVIAHRPDGSGLQCAIEITDETGAVVASVPF